MADSAGQIDIRSIKVHKSIKGFAEEAEAPLDGLYTSVSTSSRENRWFQKTAGFLDTVDTTGITATQIDFVAHGALPDQAGNSFTRNTSYAKQFALRSALISFADIKDNDVNLWAQEMRDITRAVVRRKHVRIWNILTESQSVSLINSTTTTSVGGDQWDAASGQNPVKDVYDAVRQIAINNYDISDLVLLVSPKDYMSLCVYIYGIGAQAPTHGDAMLTGRRLTEVAGCRVMVSNIVTADYAVVFKPGCVTWFSFEDVTGGVEEYVGVGREIRCWLSGEAVLTDPKSVTLIIDTQT